MNERIAFTAAEVAEKLGLSEITVRRYTSAGAFPCHRIGRSVRYTDEDVTAFLEQFSTTGGYSR